MTEILANTPLAILVLSFGETCQLFSTGGSLPRLGNYIIIFLASSRPLTGHYAFEEGNKRTDLWTEQSNITVLLAIE
ncbi:hypothetical protein CBS147345_6331 [Aspergillus niger]|nr:hypothetical protein CBS147345_6331 [Aspergillus niger]